MAKFTFPFPGRSKKQVAPEQPAEPLTKAQRILGSTQLDKNSSKAWDTASNSGISVTVSESTDPTTDSSGRGGARGRWAGSDWGDESDVLPQRFRSDEMRLADDFASDYATALREQTSSSTIRSWYDRTKQPMAVSQQTSASAIAKGLPSKAQRLLDMDNTHAPPVQAPLPEPKSKSKKKPAKLDLSSTKTSGRGKDKEKDWNNPVLGNDYVMRSPSILSPLTPNGGKRSRRKIQKRPTHESLKRQPQEPVTSRPNTAGKLESTPAQLSPPPSLPAQTSLSAQPSPALDELPSLYKHYEQMSFADAMDDEFEMVVKESSHTDALGISDEWHPDVHDSIVPSTDYRPQTQETRDSGKPGPLSSHPTIVSHSSHSSYSTQRSHPTHLTHPAQASIPPPTTLPPLPPSYQPPAVKIEPNSPIDCAASISSHHTRTSKASRRTDKSFQTADLQEKSVLMLSSDSEEDEEESYNHVPTNNSSPAASSTRRASVTDSRHMSTAESVISHSTVAEDNRSLQSRDSNLTAKRISSAPAGFLTVPQSRSSIVTSTSGLSSSMANIEESIQEEEILPLHPSPSDVSLTTSLSLTNSTTSTTMTWQGREGYGVQEARAVTMQSAEGPGPEPESEQDWTDSDVDPDHRDTVVRRESSVPAPVNAAEPTPPLSPTTMEHYMQSPESLEGVHDHFMGLTRQEQMLIRALRQRREVLRKGSLTASEEEFAQQQEQQPVQPAPSQEHLQEPSRKGHQSNPSEATITEATFNFDFPAPPTNKELLPLDSPRVPGPNMSLSSLPDPTSPGSQNAAANDAYTTDGTVFVLSAPPSSHLKKSKSILRNNSVREQPQPKPKAGLSVRRSHIPPPLNHAVSSPSNTSQRLPGPNPMSFDTPPLPRPNPGDPNPRDSLLIPRSTGSVRRQRSTTEKNGGRSTRDRTSTRGHQNQNWPIMEDESEAAPMTPRRRRRHEESDEGPGIPRPDSPISPMTDAFPMIPSRRNTYQSQQARLSAFGPPAGAEEMGLSWLGGAE